VWNEERGPTLFDGSRFSLKVVEKLLLQSVPFPSVEAYHHHFLQSHAIRNPFLVSLCVAPAAAVDRLERRHQTLARGKFCFGGGCWRHLGPPGAPRCPVCRLALSGREGSNTDYSARYLQENAALTEIFTSTDETVQWRLNQRSLLRIETERETIALLANISRK
jgi:hypothetical protein